MLAVALPVWVAVAAIWLGSIVLTLAAVRGLIRPWRPMRWLVGINALPAKPSNGGA
jgi:hypothetical protein